MEMRVMVQLLAPGVQDGEAADLRPEMLGVPSDVLERLGDRAKEQTIEVARVLQRQRPEVVRQGKDHMDVGRIKDLILPGGQPRGLSRPMAFGTAAVPTRVVRLDLVPTVVAVGDMAPEGDGPAYGNGAQGPVLRAREGGSITCQEVRAMLAHDIGHFQWRPTHGSRSNAAGKAKASRGLSVAVSAG
jgi:hypothetical protein